jgi:hypothetical protein
MLLQIAIPLAILAGSLVHRLDVLCQRGGFSRTPTRPSSLFALAATLALGSIIVWGFFHITWYLWLITIFVVGNIGGILAGAGGALTSFWIRAAPIIEACLIAIAIYAWLYAR